MNAIIVSTVLQTNDNIEYYLAETKNLAAALNITIVNVFTQKVNKINNKTYIHKGKVEEIETYLQNNEIDLVIVQDEISASIERNLTKIWNIKVIDRTNLILDIFFKNAQSKSAKNQIEIARLQYNLTKIIGSYSNLDKQGGSSVSRSRGESKLEIDKRKIRDKIQKLKTEILSEEKNRSNMRNGRKNSTTQIISLVGYTNVGKSSFINSLVSKERQIFVKDQLFATLDTSVRKLDNPKYGKYLIVDTVGFVSNLPHHLIKAFASTFEEIHASDLIIHLHDINNPSKDIHSNIVRETLETLNIKEIPIIDVYNKADLLNEENQANEKDKLLISTYTTRGYDKLFLTIKNILNESKELKTLHFAYTQMKEYNFFKSNFTFINEKTLDDGIEVNMYIDSNIANKFHYLIKE